MATEQELAVVKPFNMANELCMWLKTLSVGQYKGIEECPFVGILRELDQGKFESLIASVTPTGELVSYLTIYLARCLLRFINGLNCRIPRHFEAAPLKRLDTRIRSRKNHPSPGKL